MPRPTEKCNDQKGRGNDLLICSMLLGPRCQLLLEDLVRLHISHYQAAGGPCRLNDHRHTSRSSRSKTLSMFSVSSGAVCSMGSGGANAFCGTCLFLRLGRQRVPQAWPCFWLSAFRASEEGTEEGMDAGFGAAGHSYRIISLAGLSNRRARALPSRRSALPRHPNLNGPNPFNGPKVSWRI